MSLVVSEAPLQNGPNGIGGWLIFVIIFMIVNTIVIFGSLVRVLFNLNVEIIRYFNFSFMESLLYEILFFIFVLEFVYISILTFNSIYSKKFTAPSMFVKWCIYFSIAYTALIILENEFSFLWRASLC